ncbi:MAG: helix-turn-helix domain-containing protein [Solirubrobacteraceae bacterium]
MREVSMSGARSSRVVPGDGPAVSLAEPLLNCEEAAALLNVRVSWVRDAARLGHLPCLRVGRHLRFTRLMLENWLTGQCPATSRAGRVSPQTTARGRGGDRGVFRAGTQAALVASLAEKPRERAPGS